MITVHVSPADGIIVVGTERAHAALLGRRKGGLGLRWSDHIEHDGHCGGWFQPHTRDQQLARLQQRAEEITDTLRQAGLQVQMTTDQQPRPIDQAESELYERAQARIEAYTGFAANAADRADAHRRSAKAALSGYPMGQPILEGHHSQRRHENAIKRAHTQTNKAIAETERTHYWVSRANAATHLESFRRNPQVTLRRIKRLEADLARIERALSGEAHPELVTNDVGQVLMDGGRPLVRWQPATGDYRERLLFDQGDLNRKIAYWQDLIAQAEADGVKIWRAADFTRGDFALYHGTWWEVLRVNPKSLTLPWAHLGIGRTILRRTDALDRAGQPSTATDRLPYDKVQGRMSAQEADAAFPPTPAA